MIIERLRTGVPSFDPLIEGGVPRGFFISIVGEPGTGKTIFSLHFATQGAREGDKVIYVTTEESRESVLRQAEQLGMPLQKGVSEGLVIVIDALMKSKSDEWSMSELSVDELVDKVIQAKKKLGYGRTRLIVDSMSAFWIDKPAMARRISYFVKRVLYRWDMTAYLVSQYAVSTDLAYGFGLEHVADGIIRFKKILSRGRLHRYVLVEKMRQTNHDLRVHEIHILPGKGMVVGEATQKRVEDFRLPPEVSKRIIEAREKSRKGVPHGEEEEWPQE
jgi:KaiC domain protein